MKQIMSLAEVLDNLSRMPRTGGVLFAGMNPTYGDSLSDHSYKVTYLTLMFAKVAEKNGLEIDLAQTLTTAITHDWSETILLDIPSGSPSYQSYFKPTDIRHEVRLAETAANEAIENFLRSDIELHVNGRLSGVEQAIVNLADLVALLIEALEWKYQHLGYEWLDYLWSNTLARANQIVKDSLPFMSDLLEELQSRFDRGLKAPNPFLTKPEFQTRKPQ